MRNPRTTRSVLVSFLAACALFPACGPAEPPTSGSRARTPGAPSGAVAGPTVESEVAGYRDSSGEDDAVVVRKGTRRDGAGGDLGLVASCQEGQYARKHEAQAKCGAVVGENESAQSVPSVPSVSAIE